MGDVPLTPEQLEKRAKARQYYLNHRDAIRVQQKAYRDCKNGPEKKKLGRRPNESSTITSYKEKWMAEGVRRFISANAEANVNVNAIPNAVAGANTNLNATDPATDNLPAALPQ
jgi:hypothetical protein